MRYVSTRGGTAPTTLSDALAAGLAPDGGLFVPESLPGVGPEALEGRDSLPEIAAALLQPFFEGDALEPALPGICAEAFDFDAPLTAVDERTSLLELFHGPTAAFKDFGARFLAAALRRLRQPASPALTVLVATSGDTGAAVGAAFDGVPGMRVVILYPDGRVAPRQAHQLGAFGANVEAIRVDGNFDDCQALAKRALNDATLPIALSSANSISLGRLLPQMAYYAHSAIGFHRRSGERLNYVVPTGNLGNALAAVFAREIGAPLGRIALATNANRTLPEFFEGGDYLPRASIATLANAMDVGAPSNFERLRWLMPDAAQLRARFPTLSVSDAQIRDTIRQAWRQHRIALCPHTATAWFLRERLRGDGEPWAIVATAHPAKFDSIVEPLVCNAVPAPPALAALLARPSVSRPMPNQYADLVAVLASGPHEH